MSNYIILTVATVLTWGVINFLPIFGAYFFAKKMTDKSCVWLRVAVAVFIYLFQCGIIFSFMGMIGLLSPVWCGIAGGVTGLVFYYFPVKKSETHNDLASNGGPLSGIELTWIERFLLIYVLFLILYCAYKSTFLLGTDTYLYHLYYPAVWLEHGRIHAVSLAGLPHEYFPVFGEVLYGWFILCGDTSALTGLVQTVALVMTLSACAALWRLYNINRISILSGLYCIVSTGIIMENSCLCYTDSLTGAFLTTGICFLIIAFSDKNKFSQHRILFAVMGGLALGIAAAVKYSGLVLAPVITLLLLGYFFCRDLKLKKLSSNRYLYIAAVSSACCIGIAYYMPNLLKTGNPFYPVKIFPFFNQGICFSREPVGLKNMWNFFVNDNLWDMNIASAVFYIAILLAAIVFTVYRKNDDKKIFGIAATVLLISEVVMMTIYPAMAQARQIIPWIMACGILIAPVLTYCRSERFDNLSAAVLFVAGLLMQNISSLNIWVVYCCAVVVCACVALGKGAKYYKVSGGIVVSVAVCVIFYGSYLRWDRSLDIIRVYSDECVFNGICALREDYRNSEKPLRIATVGTWFNYMLLQDMYGNVTGYVPINKAATTHPHELENIDDLRNDVVSYGEWLGRLQRGKYTHLVVDLSCYQNFPQNLRCELDWALAHPERFQIMAAGENVYFFRIVNW